MGSGALSLGALGSKTTRIWQGGRRNQHFQQEQADGAEPGPLSTLAFLPGGHVSSGCGDPVGTLEGTSFRVSVLLGAPHVPGAMLHRSWLLVFTPPQEEEGIVRCTTVNSRKPATAWSLPKPGFAIMC